MTPFGASLFSSAALCLLASCAAQAPAAPSPPLPITLQANENAPLTWPSESEPNCPFPEEADVAQVKRALVVIAVLVDRQGYPRRIEVLHDPGFGFARAAKECALDRRYYPGVGPGGETIRAWTPPLRLLFVR